MRLAVNVMNWLALLFWMLAFPAFAEEEEDADPPALDPTTGRVLGEFEVVEEEEPPAEVAPAEAVDLIENPEGSGEEIYTEEGQAPPPIDTTTAEALQPLNKRLYRWLRPDRGDLGQVPRAQTDFTAYTVEFGEVKMGLAHITAGIARR